MAGAPTYTTVPGKLPDLLKKIREDYPSSTSDNPGLLVAQPREGT